MRPLLVLALLAGCRPAVTLSYMRPAEVTLPPNVRTVAVIDRPRTEESARAAEGLREALDGSPRIELANPAAAAEALGLVRIPIGGTVDRDSAMRLCVGSGASGLVSLERLRVGGDWRVTETTETYTETIRQRPAGCDSCDPVETEVERERPKVTASWDGSAAGTWNVLDCDGAVLTSKDVGITDTWSGDGVDLGIAKAEAGDPRDHALELAEATGASFADHISPREVTVTRAYFRAGDPEIAAGHRAVRAGDWASAEGHWEQAARSKNPKVKGKALFDLALAAEKRGDLDLAHKRAKDAKKLLGDEEIVVAYVKELGKRRLLARKLDQQMQGAGAAGSHVVPK